MAHLFSLVDYGKRKAPIFKIVMITILCMVFYFIGFLKKYDETMPEIGSKSEKPPESISWTKTSSLDFAAHHGYEDSIQSEAELQILPCEPSYIEYTPCEDAQRSLKFDRDQLIYRERHCPEEGEKLRCQIPAPGGYKSPFKWPESRDLVWFANVPHNELIKEKKNQNWVKLEDGDKLRFPGGGTMFPAGADAYIDEIGKIVNLNDGFVRTAIDTGCGVASWGAYLLSRKILTMSFAPRDTHEAQVQFALERGVPAMIGVIASVRLPYPSRAFDMAHCSRCLIPWSAYNGQYLLEVDRILRPGGYWVLSGPPINWNHRWKGWNRTADDLSSEQLGIEKAANRMCWNKLAESGDIAVWQKPLNHRQCEANFCNSQNPDAAWYTKLETCVTRLPQVPGEGDVAGGETARWPERLTAVPPRISSGTLRGVTADVFNADTELWKGRVARYKSFDGKLAQQGGYRNMLDMNAYLGGFAAALVHDAVWVMNVVPVEAEVNTLGAIYERGLIGTYQNWCEAMSTYPRTYDFIHAHLILTMYQNRCDIVDILLEMDRILRPEGTVIFRDDVDVLLKVKDIVKKMQWKAQVIDHESGPYNREKLLYAVKKHWTIDTTRQGPKK